VGYLANTILLQKLLVYNRVQSSQMRNLDLLTLNIRFNIILSFKEFCINKQLYNHVWAPSQVSLALRFSFLFLSDHPNDALCRAQSMTLLFM